MSTEGSGASRGGVGDLHNEDAFRVEDGLGLYVVCDGLSGRPAGEVAARVAIESLEGFVRRAEEALGARLQRDLASRRFVAGALAEALGAVARAAESVPELTGMATTVTMLLAQGRHGVVGHRGDSRAYLVRRERITLLTRDDEWTEAVDEHANEAFDVFSVDLHPGDTFLLCTDGAEAVVQDRALVRAATWLSPRVLASRIVSEAQRRDPACDATAVVVRVRGDGRSFVLSDPPREASFGHAIAFAGA